MGGLFLFGGMFTMVIPLVLVLALLVILALRHDDDAGDERAPAIYGALVAFVGLLTLLFAATGLAASLAELTASDSGSAIGDTSMEYESEFGMEEFEEPGSDDDDAAISSAVGFLIAGLAAAALLLAHRSLFARRRQATGAVRRVFRAYALVMCLVTAVIATAAGGAGLYTIWEAIAPGVAGTDNRSDALRELVPLVVLFAGAAILWMRHWAEVEWRDDEVLAAP